MSVDDRLREAFGAVDASWEAHAPEALRVVRRRRRDTVLRAAGATAVAASVAVVAAAALGQGGDAGEPQPVAPTSSVPSPSSRASALDGQWRSTPITAADVRAALRRAGLGTYGDEVLAGLPPTPFRVTWVVADGNGDLQTTSGGGFRVLDQEELEVTGDEVTLQPRFASGGSSVHRWVLVGDRLRLAFVSTTEGVTDGVPGEAWQRALYDAVEFHR